MDKNCKPLASKGRYGDTMMALVTKSEQDYLKQRGGSGTINPRTGHREYFLGKLLKKVLPMASNFIPGIGPVAGAALKMGLGAGANALFNKKGNKASAQANQAETENNQFQMEMAKRQGQIGDEAGVALTNEYRAMMEDPEFGTFGRFSRSGMQGEQDRYGRSTAFERDRYSRGMGDVLDLQDVANGGRAARNEAGAWQEGGSYDRFRDPRGPTTRRSSELDAMSEMDGNAMRDFESSGGYDRYSRSAEVDDTRDRYSELLERNTAQDFRDALDDGAASMRSRGMGNSTAAIEREKAMGAGMARQRAENMLKASQLSLSEIAGKQQLARGDADAYMSQDNAAFGRLKDNAAFGQSQRDFAESQFQSDRGYDQSYASNEFSKYLQGREADRNDFFARAGGEQGLRFAEDQNFFDNRGRGRKDFYDSQNAISNDEMEGMARAFDTFNKYGSAREGTINERTNLTTKPFALRAGMYEGAGKSAAYASQGLNARADRADTRAGSNAKGWGDAFAGINFGGGSKSGRGGDGGGRSDSEYFGGYDAPVNPDTWASYRGSSPNNPGGKYGW